MAEMKKGTKKIIFGACSLLSIIWIVSAMATIGISGPIGYALTGTAIILVLFSLYLILDGLSSTD